MAEDQQGTTVPPPAPNPLAGATVVLVREQFGEALLEVVEHRGETTLILQPEHIVAVCQALRDAPNLRYDFLADLTAVDWEVRDPRYDVVYQLTSLKTRASIRLKLRVGDEDTPDPEVPSVTHVWPAANWYEREVFDLFGIRFAGHPQMKRILMPADWVGYPLRKDYPLTGIRLPDPHWGGQVPFDESLPEGTGEQTLRTPEGRGNSSSEPAPPSQWPDVRVN